MTAPSGSAQNDASSMHEKTLRLEHFARELGFDGFGVFGQSSRDRRAHDRYRQSDSGADLPSRFRELQRRDAENRE